MRSRDRLEGIAEPGGICISEDAFRQVRGKVEIEFAHLGGLARTRLARRVTRWLATALSSAGDELPFPITLF